MSFRNASPLVRWVLTYAVILTGCASTQPTQRYAYLVAWNEWPYEYVLNQLGHPAFVVDDGHGGRALAYPQVSQGPRLDHVVPPDSLQTYQNLVWHLPRTDVSLALLARDYDILYVDAGGYVYSYQSNESDFNVRTRDEENMIVMAVITGVVFVLLVLAGS